MEIHFADIHPTGFKTYTLLYKSNRRELKMIKLYKLTKDGIKFVDYGVKNLADSYILQGYIIIY